MEDYFAYTETALIFLLMGAFSVIMQINKEEQKVSFPKIFQKFYMNIIAGWGIYSALIGYEEWFGNYPQKVFIIMTVTLLGVKAFDYLEKNDVLGRMIESIFQKKV
jgi:hypothetical protein